VRRYHVDFDRVVIDGGSDALAFAAARPSFYAGVIVRGDKADLKPELARNLANLSVYVVGSDASAAKKSLAAGGFPMERVKVGGADGLAAWLKDVKKVTPRSFHWAAPHPTFLGAHWIGVLASDPGPEIPTMDVEVVDTADDPNTIRMKTKLVRGVSLLLNDRIVDLDRPVRIVVNGKPVTEVKQNTNGDDVRTVKLPAALGRSFDLMFNNRQAPSIRDYQWFGDLYAAQVSFSIATDDAPPSDATTTGASTGAPEDPNASQAEVTAQRYFQKAADAEKAGQVDRARELYKKAVAEGETSVKAKAEERLKALETPPKSVR
jgi:hypothetical protein